MSHRNLSRLENFHFRDLHPNVFMGTASDRYAGWIGQIYSKQLYAGGVSRRSKKVGGKSFVEEILPVESVEEYFRHFRVLELDFTFYQPLLDENDRPTKNYHVLSTYSQHLNKEDRLILKVPQIISAKKFRQGSTYIENDKYLNPGIFTRQFYEPALGLLSPWLKGLIFEQEYQRKQDRPSHKTMAEQLDTFFKAIPKNNLYHVEIRTDALLAPPIFDVLEKHGVGHVLSHWTWLPRLSRQFAMSGGRFLNAGKQCIIRLMTPRGMRYEDAYAKTHPFTSIVDGMLDPQMVNETADIMRVAVDQDKQISVIINNRAGGNAPLMAEQIARQFLQQGSISCP